MRVEGESGALLGSYAYDGLHRQVTRATYDGRFEHMYYSLGGQLLEVRLGTSQRAYKQYVWHIHESDRLAVSYWDPDLDGQPFELYATHDALGSQTSLIYFDGSQSAVIERYDYDPYGRAVFLTPGFDQKVVIKSEFDHDILYAGYRHLYENGLYSLRFRHYHAGLGRFLTRDPLGNVDSPNLYEYVSSRPTSARDPLGLCKEEVLETEEFNLDSKGKGWHEDDGKDLGSKLHLGVGISAKAHFDMNLSGGGKIQKKCCSSCEVVSDWEVKGSAKIGVGITATLGIHIEFSAFGASVSGYVGIQGRFRGDFPLELVGGSSLCDGDDGSFRVCARGTITGEIAGGGTLSASWWWISISVGFEVMVTGSIGTKACATWEGGLGAGGLTDFKIEPEDPTWDAKLKVCYGGCLTFSLKDAL